MDSDAATWVHATGVGSLPNRDPDAAIDHVARFAPVVPYWPQLPARDPREGMIAQAIAPIASLVEPDGRPWRFRLRPGAAGDLEAALDAADPALVPSHATGFAPFLEALAMGRFTEAELVKGQLAGPATIAACVGPPETWGPARMAALARHVARAAAWQARALAGYGHAVLVVVDEPVATGEPPREILAVLAEIRSAGALAGVHCCGRFPTALLGTGVLDAASWDARLAPDLAPLVVAAGVLPMPGVVSTVDPSEPAHATARELLRRFGGHLPARVLVTPNCGLGQGTEALARRAMARVGAVVDHLRRVRASGAAEAR